MALEPPCALPWGNAMRRVCIPGSGSVAYAQSYFDPSRDTHRPGVVIAGSLLAGPPASRSNTRTEGSAPKRYASTQPEEPETTMMKSNGAWGWATGAWGLGPGVWTRGLGAWG